MILNKQRRESFQSAWVRTANYISAKHSSDKHYKVPTYPGAGWLQAEAAERNLCIGMFKDIESRPVVCGRPVIDDPYYCPQCLELLKKLDEPIGKSVEHEDYGDLPF